MGITATFSHPATPFFTGTATNPTPVAKFPVSIGGHPYLIDEPHYKRATIDIMRPPQDGSDEPGEQSYTNVGIWRKHETNWWGGAGQKWFDETGTAGGDPSNRQCFFQSKGIDPWSQNTVKLLPNVDRKLLSANTGMQLFAADGYMYLSNGTGFFYTDNIEDMNLLSDNDASFETSAAGWYSPLATATLTSSTTVALDGTHSLKMVSTGTGGMSAAHTARVPVTPFHTYTATLDIRCDAASTPRSARAAINWWDGAGVFISQTLGVAGTDSTTSWIQYAVTAIAPSNAATLEVAGTVATTASAQSHYTDRVRVKRGTSTQWTLPWRTVGASTTPVTSITSDGTTIFTARGADGIISSVIGSASVATFTAGTFDLVGYANGFLFAGNANILYSIDAGGASTTYYTHRNAGFVWNNITAAPNGVYVTGNVNDHGEVYFIGIDQTAGTPLPPVYAGDIPFGESVRTLCYYRGFMFVGTSQGVRMAQIGSGNALTEGALIPVGDVKSIRAWGQYLWCSWTDYDSISTGLARLNPALFPIVPLAPAYASDLMVTGQGNVTSVETYNDKRYFCVDGLGVFGASNTGYLVGTGTVDSGWIRYGTFERKAAVSLEVRHAPLNGEVVVGLVSEDESTVVAGVSSAFDSLGSDILAASNDTGEAFRMTLTLTPDTTGLAGPEVRRVSLRAAPIPLRTDEINVPLIFDTEETTQAGEGQPFFFDPLAEWSYLKGLESSRSVVKYQEGSLTTLVVVDKVEVVPRKWERYHNSNSDDYIMWFNGIVNVRLLTLGDS